MYYNGSVLIRMLLFMSSRKTRKSCHIYSLTLCFDSPLYRNLEIKTRISFRQVVALWNLNLLRNVVLIRDKRFYFSTVVCNVGRRNVSEHVCGKYFRQCAMKLVRYVSTVWQFMSAVIGSLWIFQVSAAHFAHVVWIT